jgi:hypothetical protein
MNKFEILFNHSEIWTMNANENPNPNTLIFIFGLQLCITFYVLQRQIQES